jgi:hypothetical protein
MGPKLTKALWLLLWLDIAGMPHQHMQAITTIGYSSSLNKNIV